MVAYVRERSSRDWNVLMKYFFWVLFAIGLLLLILWLDQNSSAFSMEYVRCGLLSS